MSVLLPQGCKKRNMGTRYKGHKVLEKYIVKSKLVAEGH